jgi:hypothetical protein
VVPEHAGAARRGLAQIVVEVCVEEGADLVAEGLVLGREAGVHGGRLGDGGVDLRRAPDRSI